MVPSSVRKRTILYAKPPDHVKKTRLFKYMENFTSKTENFRIKNSDIFHISAQNIDCGYSLESPRQGGSNENPQFMFLSRNKKNNVYTLNPSFTIKKWGLKVSKLYKCVSVSSLSGHQFIRQKYP